MFNCVVLSRPSCHFVAVLIVIIVKMIPSKLKEKIMVMEDAKVIEAMAMLCQDRAHDDSLALHHPWDR
jgi:CO dehydrogenase/acetyl-CoA synthase beta subunit